METNPVISLFLAIGLIILAARLAGATARRLHQPRVLGELLVGVILGPTLLNFLHWDIFNNVPLDETIREFAELGVLILMFIVGLEVHLEDLAEVGFVAVLAGTVGAVAPIALGMPLVMLDGYSWEAALFAGVTLAATSVSISAQVLFELDLLKTREGSALLGAALVDDVLAIILVSITIAVTAVNSGDAESSRSLVEIIVRMVGYLAIGTAVAWYVLPRLIDKLSEFPQMSQSYGIPAFAMIFVLLYGWSAEEIGGVAAITGAFLAGAGLSRAKDNIHEEMMEAMRYIAYAFLVPIFFVHVGLGTDLSMFPISATGFAVAVLFIAVISKIGGAGLGAKLGGFNNGESLRLGVCMISRGEVGLIVATLGVTSGIFDPNDRLFAVLFMSIILTTVLTPPLVRQAFKMKEKTPIASAG